MTWATVVTLASFGASVIRLACKTRRGADLLLAILLGAWCFACAGFLVVTYLA